MLKFTRLVLSSILILITTFSGFSQTKKAAKDSSTVIIFNKPTSTKSEKKQGQSSENNIIKIAPLGLVSGTFPLLYERRITDFLSIQIGAGLTNRNYSRNAFQSENGIESIKYTNGVQNDLSEYVYEFSSRKATMGSMFTIQPRVYFASEGLEGSYLGLSFDNYKYNFEIPGIAGSSNNYTQTGPTKSEYEKVSDFMVHFGSQSLNDRISFEWSTAIGIRNVTGNKYAADFSGPGFSLREGTGEYKQTLLNFNIGLKVGYHF
jgi:hypothetical protein